MSNKKPARLFILNDSKDYQYLESLGKQLAILQKGGHIESWNRGDIRPGEVIEEVVNHRLKFADIVLLLISSDFLASEECHLIKLKAAEMEKILVPIVLRPCLYEYDEVIEKLIVKGEEIKPISTWDNQDMAFTVAVKGIMKAVKKFNDLKRILFLSADPRNVPKLDVIEEQWQIREALGESYKEYDFKFEVLEHTTINSLITKLLQLHNNPYIIHFSGHGSKEGSLFFENSEGNYQLLEGRPLANLFKRLSSKTECIILNACYSKRQTEEMIKQVPYIVGMNNKIKDTSAIQFATSFYSALGAGKTIPDAFEIGKIRVDLGDDEAEHEVLELLVKT